MTACITKYAVFSHVTLTLTLSQTERGPSIANFQTRYQKYLNKIRDWMKAMKS